MAALACPQLHDLLIQAKFAPENQRLGQIDACEALLRLIHPGRQYPFEFICFHLTGYRPHISGADALVDHGVLLSDLPAYAEQVSRSLRIPADSIPEKVYTQQTLARRFRVSLKTISRWRRAGLVGRYLVFPDGRTRLAFAVSTVEAYVRRYRRRVQQGRVFSRLTSAERQAVLDRLARWARRCPDRRQEAIRRTARKFSRSVETVRSILAAAEQAAAADVEAPLFVQRAEAADAETRRRICQLYLQGVPVADLIRRFGRSKSNIYRAVNQVRAEQLRELDIFYMDSPEFYTSGARQHILRDDVHLPAGRDKSLGAPEVSDQRAPLESLNTYVRDICQAQLLSSQQETSLFRKYNYVKFLAAQIQRRIVSGGVSARLNSQMRGYLIEARRIKHQLITSNLRLVVSVARKHTRSDSEMLDLIGEGNIVLMNAVEKFDFARGIKFSTYATWALVKRYATLRTQQSKRPVAALEDELLEVACDLRLEESKVLATESAHRSLQDVIEDILDQREKTIVREHFGLTDKTEIIGQRKAKSLAKIANVLGLSKERVRQVELMALQKLRRVLTREQFDLLTQA